MPHLLTAQELYCDAFGDASPRPTDEDLDGIYAPDEHRLPDILSCRIGGWTPASPAENLFDGQWSDNAQFFRLDLELAGLLNPPGPLGCCGNPSFDPFRYGPNPLYGYIEIDIDDDVGTGGELDLPQTRFVGNAVRFGGHPTGAPYKNRVAVDATDFTSPLDKPPFVRRSGEDFHIALVGWEIHDADIIRSDERDWTLGPGETWLVSGHLFQRAHGYRMFSTACCRAGTPVGSYEPRVTLRFSHDQASDRTIVSLVYPLTNEGSAAVEGDPEPELPDPYFTNHNSIQEALLELKVSAMAATREDRDEPEFALLEDWEKKDPEDFLDPARWRVTLLVGGSYAQAQDDALFVWSDIWPSVTLADVDGKSKVNKDDLSDFNDYLVDHDGEAGFDQDGQSNGRIVLPGLGPNFSLYDLDYNGVIDNGDRALIIHGAALVPGDYDQDGDVDQEDFGQLQLCLTGPEGAWESCGCYCADIDLDGDTDVDQDDVAVFAACSSGPSVPGDPDCRP